MDDEILRVLSVRLNDANSVHDLYRWFLCPKETIKSPFIRSTEKNGEKCMDGESKEVKNLERLLFSCL